MTVRSTCPRFSRFAAPFAGAARLSGFVLACLAPVLPLRAQANYATPYTFTELAGSYPSGSALDEPWGVAVDAKGNVYVADRSDDTIRMIAGGGTITILAGSPGASGSADGTGSAARFNVPQGIAVDGSGNVYVGDSGNGTVRKITSAGVVTTLAGTPGATGSADGTGGAASFDLPCGLAVDASGNVYVADAANQTIRKITPAGVVTTLAGTPGVTGSADGTGGAASFDDPFFVAVDASGSVYVADNANCTIRKVTASGAVTTLAGSPGAKGLVDGTGGTARFNYPIGIAVDAAGNVYVSEQANQTIRRISSAGVVTTLAGVSNPVPTELEGGMGEYAVFNSMAGVAVDSVGNIYAASSYGVVFWGALGVPVQTSATTAYGRVGQSFSYAATFSGVLQGPFGATGLPAGLSIDPNTGMISGTITGGAGVNPVELTAVNGAGSGLGYLYIGVGVPSPPTAVSIVISTGEATISFGAPVDNGGSPITGYTVTVSSTSVPYSLIATGASSPITITGLSDLQPYVFTVEAVTSAGSGVAESGPEIEVQPYSQSADLGSAASFSIAVFDTLPLSYQWQLNGSPIAGATSSSLTIPNVQQTDAGSYTVVVSDGLISETTPPALLMVMAPTTYSGSVLATPGGPGPNGIAVDKSGNAYVTVGDAVEKITSAGAVTLLAGSLAAPGSADGSGAAASFDQPTGLAVDASGNIYVADSGNNSIRKVTPLGAVSTVAGLTLGKADGTGVSAEFNNPTAVAVDASGNIYVADTGNNELRKVAPGGTTSTLLAPPYSFDNDPPSTVAYTLAGVAVDSTGVPCVGFKVAATGTVFPNTSTAYYSCVLRVTGAGLMELLFQDEDPLDTSFFGPGRGDGAIASDGLGNLYVLCGDGPFVGTAMISASVGAPTPQPTLLPVAIAADSHGNIYEANPPTGAVIVITPVGTVPVVEAQPTGGTVAFGAEVTLSVTASGTPAPTYQWKVDGVSIPGATSSTYVASMPGTYTALITNSAGTVTSKPAVITAVNRLANISCRALVGTQGNLEIAGFVVAGPPGSTEQVLIRAVGPTLAQYGVTGILYLPQLTLLDSKGNGLASNTGWNSAPNAAQIAAAAASTGAFALPLDSGDSAILISLPPGAYTAQIQGLNTTSGVALAEVYEVNAGDPELINISTRAYVGTGSSVEIGGFIVTGSQPAKVLIRAVGPTLSQFGVNGVLAKPSLSVMDSSGNTVATNTGWSTNSSPAAIASEMAAVGAFPLPSGSADCALVLMLPPGAYTAIVSGVGGTSGVALVEVYQAP
jgi:sugar lactone lactonase YvrE